MGNALNEDLTDRYVVLSKKSMAPAYHDIKFRVARVSGGFGAAPYATGTALLVETPFDGEKFRTEGSFVERFATDEEIALVTSYDPHGGQKHRVYEEN